MFSTFKIPMTSGAPILTYDTLFPSVALLLKTQTTQNKTTTLTDIAGGTWTKYGSASTNHRLSPYHPSGWWATYFNGSNAYFEIPTGNPAVLYTNTANWTIEAWVKLSSYTNNNVICSKRGTTLNYQCYFLATTGYMAFGVSTNVYSSTTAPPLGVWTHVAWVNVGSTTTMYINGVSVYSFNPVGFGVNSGTFKIGYSNDITTVSMATYAGQTNELILSVCYAPKAKKRSSHGNDRFLD